jgi:hypothetical protein
MAKDNYVDILPLASAKKAIIAYELSPTTIKPAFTKNSLTQSIVQEQQI